MPPVAILFQDDDFVFVDKPSGMLVHRGWAQDERVLMTELRDFLGERVYPAHRLDRGASGVVVFARSSASAAMLGTLFAQQGAVQKTYVALVRGNPNDGIIDHPIPKKPDGPRVPAVTHVRVLERFGRYALVEAQPKTGRLHQIRRHLKHVSCPLIGDVNYGKGEHNRLFRERYGLCRLALHARSLAFADPRTGIQIGAVAELPDDFRNTVEALRRERIDQSSAML